MYVCLLIVMGKHTRPKQFCFRRNEPVRGLRMHYRRRHPYDPQPDHPSHPAVQPLLQTPSNLFPVPRTPSPLPRLPQPLQSTPRRALVPATLAMNQVNADDDDDWLREPLCQVDLLEGVTSPVSSGSGDAPPAPPPRSPAAASALTRRMVDRGTQESGDPESHRRMRTAEAPAASSDAPSAGGRPWGLQSGSHSRGSRLRHSTRPRKSTPGLRLRELYSPLRWLRRRLALRRRTAATGGAFCTSIVPAGRPSHCRRTPATQQPRRRPTGTDAVSVRVPPVYCAPRVRQNMAACLWNSFPQPLEVVATAT